MTDDDWPELLRMLRVERTKLSGELILAKRELRELVARIEALEARLVNIEDSENYLDAR